jgi:LysM repeat protein
MERKSLVRVRTMLVVVFVMAALAVPASAHASGQVHVVQPGENLYRIARRYGTTIQAIANANGIRNPSYIWVGQRLFIPSGGGSWGGPPPGGGGVYIVRRGDTVFSIALRYRTTIRAIAAANGLANPRLIYVGQRLRIPGGGGGSWGGPPPGHHGGVYIVRPGDTVFGIALRYGTTIRAIASANGLANPRLIYVGQRLRIP